MIQNTSTAVMQRRLIWIPPCRKRLERASDYEAVA